MRLVTYHDGSGAHLGALRGDAVVALDAKGNRLDKSKTIRV